MVKVIGPLFSLEASGKFGSQIFARNQYGSFTYPIASYTSSSSPEQILWRTAFSDAITYWLDPTYMTDAKRDMWEEYAQNFPTRNRLGKPIHLSGRDWFVKANIYRLRAGLLPHWTPSPIALCNIHPVATFSQKNWGIVASLDTALTGDQLFQVSYVLNQSIARKFCPHNTVMRDVFLASYTPPYLCIPNSLLSSSTARQFLVYRFIDGNGFASNKLINYIDVSQSTSTDVIYTQYNCYIESLTPDDNNSTDRWWYVLLLSTGTTVHSLFAIDLSDYPIGSICSSAILSVKTQSVTIAGTVDLHNVLVSWVGSEVTYNNRNSSTTWSTPGMLADTDYDSTIIDSKSITTAGTWYNFDITSWVNAVLAGTISNYGLVFRALSADTNLRFMSCNYTLSVYPYVTITW